VAALRRHHPARTVTSLYFDSASYSAYQDSIGGFSERLKVRLRWYGLPGAWTEPILELKHRSNHTGWKRTYRIGALDLGAMTWDELRPELARRVGPSAGAALARMPQPVLVSQYQRAYFHAPERGMRVTVDTDLRFFDQRWRPALNLTFNAIQAGFAVVECKAAPSRIHHAASALAPLGLRRTRFSKYCFGLERLRGV
jgi:hypothetical protein